MNEDHQRSGLVGLGRPEVENVPGVRTIRDIGHAGFDGIGVISGLPGSVRRLLSGDEGVGFFERQDAVLVGVGLRVLLQALAQLPVVLGGLRDVRFLGAKSRGTGEDQGQEKGSEAPVHDGGLLHPAIHPCNGLLPHLGQVHVTHSGIDGAFEVSSYFLAMGCVHAADDVAERAHAVDR